MAYLLETLPEATMALLISRRQPSPASSYQYKYNHFPPSYRRTKYAQFKHCMRPLAFRIARRRQHWHAILPVTGVLSYFDHSRYTGIVQNDDQESSLPKDVCET
jgi:hypothetical protein